MTLDLSTLNSIRLYSRWYLARYKIQLWINDERIQLLNQLLSQLTVVVSRGVGSRGYSPRLVVCMYVHVSPLKSLNTKPIGPKKHSSVGSCVPPRLVLCLTKHVLTQQTFLPLDASFQHGCSDNGGACRESGASDNPLRVS
jgi:hypothetical protein